MRSSLFRQALGAAIGISIALVIYFVLRGSSVYTESTTVQTLHDVNAQAQETLAAVTALSEKIGDSSVVIAESTPMQSSGVGLIILLLLTIGIASAVAMSLRVFRSRSTVL